MRGFRELDRVLRGGPAPDALPPLRPLLFANAVLAAAYGLCMGSFGVLGRAEPEFRQLFADLVKVPALFTLTLLVTFPSLYVFNALVGSRFGMGQLARLMSAALGVLLAVLAAFGPIVAFFSLTTTNYPFIVLLNVAVFSLAAAFGGMFLFRTITKPPPATAKDLGEYEVVDAVPPAEPDKAPLVFRVWVVVFALVGAQMSWVLRPFIGSPDLPFTWLRPRESSFFEAVGRSLKTLIGGH